MKTPVFKAEVCYDCGHIKHHGACPEVPAVPGAWGGYGGYTEPEVTEPFWDPWFSDEGRCACGAQAEAKCGGECEMLNPSREEVTECLCDEGPGHYCVVHDEVTF